MDFQPETTIYFLRTGIDENNKVVCKTQEELFATLTSAQCLRGRSEADSFQRADGGFCIRINHEAIPYYNLLNCDTIMYANSGTMNCFYIVGNITSVEWKNPDCSFVYFKIDHFMTYQTMIDWTSTYAYVEREHVKGDWAADGHPNFTNMGPVEDFNVVPDTPFYHFEKTFNPNFVLIHSPYDSEGEPQFDGQIVGNLYSSLNSQILATGAANTYFKAIADKKSASINNIVGVYGCPQDFHDIIQNGGTFGGNQDLPPVDTANMTSFPIEYRNAKCWSAPFCVVKLQSSEGSEITFNPQWFGNDVSAYLFKYKYSSAGKQFGGAMATFDNTAGAFEWKNWADWCVMISQLPACPWTADGFKEWQAINNPRVIAQQINNGVHTLTGVLGGLSKMVTPTGSKNDPGSPDVVGGVVDVVNSASRGVTNGISIATEVQSAEASGAVVNGVGSFGVLFDIGQEAWGFKVTYLTVQNYLMRSIDQYFDRFGYRVNQLKRLEIENRPIWTFVKTVECHVAVGQGVPFVSENAINAMFNRGVTMWKADKFSAGRKIGDFSAPEQNKGVAT